MAFGSLTGALLSPPSAGCFPRVEAKPVTGEEFEADEMDGREDRWRGCHSPRFLFTDAKGEISMFLFDIRVKDDDLKKVKDQLKKVTDFVDDKVETVKTATGVGKSDKVRELELQLAIKKLELELELTKRNNK